MKGKWKIVIEKTFDNCEYIYPIQQKKVSDLIEYFKKNKNVKSIIIFGSSISSNCHIGSDVDVYVDLYEDENIIKDKYFDFSYDLWTNFSVDERLYKEIMKKGVIVYEKRNTIG